MEKYTSTNKEEEKENLLKAAVITVRERKKDDMPDLTNNVTIDYTIFAYDNKELTTIS